MKKATQPNKHPTIKKSLQIPFFVSIKNCEKATLNPHTIPVIIAFGKR